MNVALLGEARTGKSTAAQYLADAYGLTRVGIAYPTKRAIGRQIADWTGDQRDPLVVCNEWKDRPDNHVRPVLQLMADVLAEVADPSTIVADLVVRQQLAGVPVVCDDARMPWETRMLLDNGWLVFRLVRHPDLRGAPVAAHARTEGLVDDCPYTVTVYNNDNTGYELRRDLDRVMAYYQVKPYAAPEGALGPAIRARMLSYLGDYLYSQPSGPVGLGGC